MNKSNKNSSTDLSTLESLDSLSLHRQLALHHAHTAHRLVQQRYVSDAKPIFVDKGR
jgi:hypothetical protein